MHLILRTKLPSRPLNAGDPKQILYRVHIGTGVARHELSLKDFCRRMGLNYQSMRAQIASKMVPDGYDPKRTFETIVRDMLRRKGMRKSARRKCPHCGEILGQEIGRDRAHNVLVPGISKGIPIDAFVDPSLEKAETKPTVPDEIHDRPAIREAPDGSHLHQVLSPDSQRAESL